LLGGLLVLALARRLQFGGELVILGLASIVHVAHFLAPRASDRLDLCLLLVVDLADGRRPETTKTQRRPRSTRTDEIVSSA